jgi:hypothetical protein
VKGGYSDNGDGLAVTFEFNPAAAVGPKENSLLTIFAIITSYRSDGMGIGLSRPVYPPPSFPIESMNDWEVTVTFDDNVSVTKTIRVRR